MSAANRSRSGSGSRLGAAALLEQVETVRGGEVEAPPVSQRNDAGLRSFFTPITGQRRTGLVVVEAIRTREEGQVRTGDLTARPDFEELVASIRAHGVLQPVGLTWDEAAGCFWTDFGHRRVAASRAAGLERVPAFITIPGGVGTVDAPAMTERQLIENLQRTELPALDVAHAIKRLVDAGRNAVDVAASIGKSKSWVSKHLKLLELPGEILARAEESGVGHETLYVLAQADVSVEEKTRLLDVALRDGRPALSREVETIAVAKQGSAAPRGRTATPGAAPDRALRAASKRALEAARHLHNLLRASSSDATELQRSAERFVTALEKLIG